jgi:NAD-dependent dihydropyrimidine dehydrogenase PreA subunit
MNNQKSIKIKDLKPEYVRFFDPLFSLIKKLINILNYFLYKGFTKEFNPMNHLGAIANLLFGIATITGIILLLWYKPSVYQAYPSLEQLKEPNIFSYIGQLFRSLHRYSSDVVLGIMWLEGWTGYWLVWDIRAQQIAIGTSKMLDLIPIFADPLSRTFLTDEHINTLLFFLIFFFHMLMPLAIIFGLWLHINRLNRSNWITNKSLSIIIIVSLIVISLIKPAISVESAKMQIIPKEFTMDYWYLLPLWFTDRLNGGVLWFITLILSIIIFSFPWIFYKQKFQPSIVNEERCQNCQQCFIGCPQCSYREGTNWLEERLFKDREPFLRKDKVNPNKIKIFLNDSNNPDQWNYNFEENLNFKKWETRVILFDKIHQFKVY